MTTQNTVILDSVKDAVIVPSIAIKKEDGKSVVYVLKKGKDGLDTAERREVQTGLIDSLKTQILSGVEEGEEVVTKRNSAAEISEMLEKEKRKMGF